MHQILVTDKGCTKLILGLKRVMAFLLMMLDTASWFVNNQMTSVTRFLGIRKVYSGTSVIGEENGNALLHICKHGPITLTKLFSYTGSHNTNQMK